MKLLYAKWLEKLDNISFDFFIVQHIMLLALKPVYVFSVMYFILSITLTLLLVWILNKYVIYRIQNSFKYVI